MMHKIRAINILERHIVAIEDLRNLRIYRSNFLKWKRDTEIAIENIFGCDSRHITDFKNVSYSVTFGNSFSYNMSTGETSYSEQEREEKSNKAFLNGLELAELVLKSFTQEIEDYWITLETEKLSKLNSLIEKIELICNKFHQVARQMRSRHENRSTLEIKDEYDVQDLFHCQLISHGFDDIRREENNPSYAGSNSRSDFLLKPEQTAIEIKKTRQGLNDKKLGEELSLDIQKYQSHPDYKTLVCFVYDPEGRINNPRGLERDLEQQTEKIKVKVFIRP